MKTYNYLALAAGTLLLAACIPSVNPFYREKDLTFDSRLIGEWHEKENPDDGEIWKFQKAEDVGYKLSITEKAGKQGEFAAHLFKLKEKCFLDIIPTDCKYATNQADLVSASMVPGHLLLRVSQLEPSLKLAISDFDWLEKYLQKNPQSLPHRTQGGSILLTASTRQLQSFILKHLGEGELFGKPGEMVRR